MMCSMTKLLPPSPQALRIERALSGTPRRKLTVEEARQQTERHLRTAKEQLLKNGHANTTR
jgi:hypothetical protein